MKTRWLLVLPLVSAGCDIYHAPKRVDALESRVDELSAAVSALTGKPVGAPKKDDEKEHDEKDEKKDKKKDDKKDEKKDEKKHGKDDDEKTANGRDEDAPPMPEKKKKHDDDDEAKADEAKADKDAEKEKDKDKDDEDAPKEKKKSEKHAAHFAYAGADGPEEWGDLDSDWKACKKGKEQSPIDIAPKASAASPITFRYKPTTGSVVDNGHTLQVNLSEGSSIVIDDHAYELVQFHVHTPSEHTIAGEKYPLEVHLVHKDKDGKLAVVGVLYDTGADSKALASVWKKWPAKQNAEKKLDKAFDPTALLPESRNVYRYEGSLTTPPCSEGVVWNVMRRTMTDSKADLTLVGLHMTPNARPVQPLGERTIE